MSSFSIDWLNLREPIDAVSRSRRLSAALALACRPPDEKSLPLQVIDLGAGTGANLRYLAPILGGRQEWLLVDRDPLLLEALERRVRVWADSSGARLDGSGRNLTVVAPGFECLVRTAAMDLAIDLDRLAVPYGALVCASALLDLVSEGWLRRLGQICAKAAASVCFALNYDGRISCNPVEPEDSEIRELFNMHQLTDKGFGSALGPGCTGLAERVFSAAGYQTHIESSDWHTGPDDRALQYAVAGGWFDAACEIQPGRRVELQKWLQRRYALIESGQCELIVGHGDLAGWLLEPDRDESLGSSD
jgi:hypothetical protein